MPLSGWLLSTFYISQYVFLVPKCESHACRLSHSHDPASVSTGCVYPRHTQIMGCLDGVPEVLLLGSKVSLIRQESSSKVLEAKKEKHRTLTSAVETQNMYTVGFYTRKTSREGEIT